METDLMSAASIADISEITSLLAAGADVHETNELGMNALMCAVRGFGGDILTAIAMLVKAGADINAQNNKKQTALNIAVGSWSYSAFFSPPVRPRLYVEVISLLLSYGAKTDICDRDGDTPMTECFSHTQVVTMLLAHGADINHQNYEGETLLIRLCQNLTTQSSLIDFVIKCKPNVNLSDTDGMTALHLSASRNDAHALRSLLTAGADVDLIDSEGKSALHYAARGNVEMVSLLLSAGAKINAADSEGITPLQISIYWFDNDDVTRLLLSSGAEISMIDPDAQAKLSRKGYMIC